jgi:hypothetical protein
MYLNAALVLGLAVVVSCDDHDWRAATTRDREYFPEAISMIPAKHIAGRSPCPMLNSLANHAFLPRSGLNVSVDDLVNGLERAINLSPNSSRPVALLAATTSTTGNPNTINLDDLNKHGGKFLRPCHFYNL